MNYPDNTTISKECVLNGNIWIGTVEGCATSGTSTNGFYVTASGIDENENVITNYVLGAGDLYVKDLDGTIDPERVGTKMYFNDALPANPKKGDATFIDQTLNVYDGTNWVPVATDYYTKAEVDEALGEVEDNIPTKVSDLTNDSGFVTTEEVQPLHVYESGTINNTGVAARAAALASAINRPLLFEKYGTVSPYITFDPSELTPKFSLQANYVAFFPWKLSKFFETTYSPELELVWWCGDFCRVRGGRFAIAYTGFMWRTKGLGFAIPCSQDGIPDGRLFEITQIDEVNHKVGNNGGTENHTITGNENWSAILTIDEQENQITCTRSIVHRAKENKQTFPTLEDIPTSTSQLANDSGFITSADVPTKTSDLTNDSGFITATALTPYREKSDLYYEHSFHKANWQNVPRFIMNYDGTQTIFDKFDSTLNRWNVSTGTSDWYVQESLTGMEADPQFTLTKLESGISNILPTEGAGTTTVSFIDMGIEGTFTMDMSDQLVCKVYVDRQISALEARIAALENNNQ